jgi:hypothetical protein
VSISADAAPAPSASGAETPLSRGWLAVALGVWACSTFGHGLGLEVAKRVFRWARRPDTWLSAEGGAVGLYRLEFGLGAFFFLIALAALGTVAWRNRDLRPARADALRELGSWLVWALLVVLIWKAFIVYATELTHFVQYALVGFLLALAWRGRDPQLAFLIAVGLGVVDEVWQHYGLHAGEALHWMDFTDPVLDALGAAGGILPFVTVARLRGDPQPDRAGRLKVVVVAVACALLPLLLLSPETHGWLFGDYLYHPVWSEYRNDKPVHWPGPPEGVPLVLIMLLVLGFLLEPRRRGLSHGALAVVLALAVVAFQPPSRKRGTPVHHPVPRALAKRTSTPIVVDGELEEAWDRAPELGPFVLNQEGTPATHRTTARVLWDAGHLYFAFEVSDPDVWARAAERDDGDLPQDEVVEVFLDDGGDEVTYFELEVSPANVVQDLFCFIPQAPVDYNPDANFIAMNAWDARGLRTAVGVRGTLQTVASHLGLDPPPRVDGDTGWVVEIALPWRAIRPFPSNRHAHRPVPPRVGDEWRLGLYRLERPRADAAAWGHDPAATLPLNTAQALFDPPERLQTLISEGRVKEPAPGQVLAHQVHQQAAVERTELQAWAPTFHPSFHLARRFGVLRFVE